jgi:hypothetical protein
MRRLETWVEGREPPAVEHQESLSLRTEQDPPRAQYQHGGDRSQTRIGGEYLAKARAIERQQSLASGGDEEFRPRRAGGDSHRHRTRFRGGQFFAGAVLVLECAAPVVQEEPGPRAHHDPIFIGSQIAEAGDGRYRVDRRRGGAVHRYDPEREFRFRENFGSGFFPRIGRAPEHQRDGEQRDCQKDGQHPARSE